ncbi:AraC family transcriptional regulator of adaptative response / methylphosphotriester-DNA alkyltransferase methyltransferase [Pedobacter africanus]|uniref:AraC-like DNA-binding protein n=1 Tax=Pedobacter africanus TaxID=151894 RepID=A0ACC6KSP9_9SPHI|nr:helix-turn-helix domain-containing protein [Pedobacter africanus]MDR6782284.1 AraC-like DNA-binding protein [Pedobacter africanus]
MQNSGNKRAEQIAKQYFTFLDQHVEDVSQGNATDFLELNQIANALHISHSHLSDTIQKSTGHHPCHFYDLKIVEKAKSLLIETDLSIAFIAKKLTYDPSNFSKFFKKFTGQTAGEFRKQQKPNNFKSSEKFTTK